MKELIANGLWWLSCVPEAVRFNYSTRQVEKTQRRRLSDILRHNQSTRYGNKFDFKHIKDVEEYQSRVPLMDESLLKSYVDEIGDGQRDVLFPGIPYCLEPTSGSTAESKLIPYSTSLHQEFQSAIATWVADLFWKHPNLLTGSAYWSISPTGHIDKQTRGGVRVGFQDDSEYLNPLFRKLLSRVLAVPMEVSKIENMETFRYVTLTFLLKAKNLSLISIWNPTFLTRLLDPLEDWFMAISQDIRHGSLHPPSPLSVGMSKILCRYLGGPDIKRADELANIYKRKNKDKSLIQNIWPRLLAISCWADASARGPSDQLIKSFPHVTILPKGLLATEGVVTVPKIPSSGAMLAIRSHFYEFLSERNEDRPITAWNLKQGQRYSVVLTTGGGLYRYKLNDLVEVVGFYHECPLLKFVGKTDKVSDLYGEKLHESHIAGIIDKLFTEEAQKPSFALLAPDDGERVERYVLYLSGDERPSQEKIERWRFMIESELCKNIHYDYCRRLGQLAMLDICWIEEGARFASLRYLEFYERRGQKIGDIKTSYLDKNRKWKQVFEAPQICV